MKSKFFITIFILPALIFLASAGWFYVFSKISSERKAISELRKDILRSEKKIPVKNLWLDFLAA